MIHKHHRQHLILRLEGIARECRQIIIDVESYNENNPSARDNPIDADPDGELKNTIRWCERNLELLKKEGGEE